MQKVFMVHGFRGEPNGGWRPWLMGELAQKGIYACALPMPNPHEPEKGQWVRAIKESIGSPNEETFLIGHSLGVPAILRYLETLSNNQKIGGAVLVSGPAFEIKKEGYEAVNGFLDIPFDFKHIKNSCKSFFVIHGDNDPSVSFSDAEYLSKSLSCDLITVPNGGHLGGHEGFYKLPEALKALERMMK